MAGNSRPWPGVVLFLCSTSLSLHGHAQPPGWVIPETNAVTLTGQHLSLPKDLPERATVLIIGFGRHSQDATTAWEKPVRTQLAKSGSIGFYDIAMISEVPGFIRPMVLRAIKHEVPDVLKPNFLPLTNDEDAWKRVAGYAPDQPEAAYVLLVDHSGHVRWASHVAFSPASFADLRRASDDLARSGG